MSTNTPDLIFTTAGFTPRAELGALVTEKAAKIFRHVTAGVTTLRVHVARENVHSGPPAFAARIICNNTGSDHTVHAREAEPMTGINEVFGKLDRTLAAAFGAKKHQLHHPHAIELDADLPKV